jgi:hypothetical protein
MVFWIPEFAEDLVFQGGCIYNLTREKFRNQKKHQNLKFWASKVKKNTLNFGMENLKIPSSMHICISTGKHKQPDLVEEVLVYIAPWLAH